MGNKTSRPSTCFVRLGFIGGDGLWIPLKSSCVAERAYKWNRKSLFACQRLLNIFFNNWVWRRVRVLLLLLSTVSIIIVISGNSAGEAVDDDCPVRRM